MITQQELNDYELVHGIGGRGLYWLGDLGDDMSKCCWAHPVQGISVVYLASNAMLKPMLVRRPVTDEEPNPPMLPAAIDARIMAHVVPARQAFRDGKVIVENQRLVPA